MNNLNATIIFVPTSMLLLSKLCITLSTDYFIDSLETDFLEV